MPPVELDYDVIATLNGIVAKEKLENPSDAVRSLFNGYCLSKAVITKQEDEITKLEDEIKRLKGIMETAGIA